MSIECKDITKQFGSTRALDQVSLTLEAGHIYGLLGNNGAGKSTLLSILTDRQLPDQGTVTVDGQPVRNNDAALHKVFMVGEQNFFPEDMKIKRALYTMTYFYPDFDLRRAHGLAKQFGLSLKKKIPALSTGYSSIFRLILGLSVNTPYVIFDEPVLGLDAQHRELFYRLLVEKFMAQSCTILLSTHLISEVENLIDHTIILREGRILRNAPTEELLTSAYTLSGPAGLVEQYTEGKQILTSHCLPAWNEALCAYRITSSVCRKQRTAQQRERMQTMSMNLKPAIRYQLREYLISCLVFWAINALLIGIGFLVLSLNLGSGDRSGYTYNGYGFACAIFFLVFGLILPRQAIRLCVQMGVSRRTTFLSLFLSALLPAVCLSLAGELLLSLSQFAADHTQFQLEFSDLFSMIYLKQGLPLTFLQHTASILFSAACMLACYSLGLFFTFLFWRLNKVGCIIAALAIPVSLIGFPPLLAKAEEVFPPVRTLFLTLGDTFFHSPWGAILLLLVVVLLFSLVGWLLIRRTNIRGGMLSSK